MCSRAYDEDPQERQLRQQAQKISGRIKSSKYQTQPVVLKKLNEDLAKVRAELLQLRSGAVKVLNS